MSGSYEYIDHTADIAVKVSADSIEELFSTAAYALRDTAVENTNFASVEIKRINLNEYSTEELLVSFLNELNFFLSARKWVMKSIPKLVIEEYEEIWQLKIECEGSSDVEFTPKEEIKAVTFHQMQILSDTGIYYCTIVFDI
jgi:SHS2 domain-containing protein